MLTDVPSRREGPSPLVPSSRPLHVRRLHSRASGPRARNGPVSLGRLMNCRSPRGRRCRRR